jgi:hypothetical protein
MELMIGTLVAAAFLVSAPARASDPLVDAQKVARTALDESVLRQELRRAADALEKAARELGGESSSAEVARRSRAALTELRQRTGALENDEPYRSAGAFYAELARRDDFAPFAADLSLAAAEELREAAREAANEPAIYVRLPQRLRLPPRGADPADWIPEDLTLPEFRQLGPVLIFLAKHRAARPESYQRVSTEDVSKGRFRVQTGVEAEGVVTRVSGPEFDHDSCFNIGRLHFEITPEWRAAHRMTLPKVGDRVRVRGWTYFDVFHESERDTPDSKDSSWEVHPAQDVVLLPRSR